MRIGRNERKEVSIGRFRHASAAAQGWRSYFRGSRDFLSGSTLSAVKTWIVVCEGFRQLVCFCCFTKQMVVTPLVTLGQFGYFYATLSTVGENSHAPSDVVGVVIHRNGVQP